MAGMTIVSFSLATDEDRLGGPNVRSEGSLMSAFAAARSMLVALAGFLLGLLITAVAIPLAAHAEPPAPAAAKPAGSGTAPPGSTVISIVVYGDDPCPKGKDDEIVVCARQPESERYRIPKAFRGKKQQTAPNNSWGNKVRSADDAGRMSAGLPNTCSAVGSGGQTGCFQQFQVQQMQQRRQQRNSEQDSSNDNAQD
jgi:hypothetical protein